MRLIKGHAGDFSTLLIEMDFLVIEVDENEEGDQDQEEN
jgi:hypothetical protein